MVDLKPYFQDCLYKKYFGIECPGCGMQRSFEQLINGNIHESIAFYPPLTPLLLMFVFIALHLKFSFRKGAQIILYLFVFNVSFISVNYIWKILA